MARLGPGRAPRRTRGDPLGPGPRPRRQPRLAQLDRQPGAGAADHPDPLARPGHLRRRGAVPRPRRPDRGRLHLPRRHRALQPRLPPPHHRRPAGLAAAGLRLRLLRHRHGDRDHRHDRRRRLALLPGLLPGRRPRGDPLRPPRRDPLQPGDRALLPGRRRARQRLRDALRRHPLQRRLRRADGGLRRPALRPHPCGRAGAGPATRPGARAQRRRLDPDGEPGLGDGRAAGGRAGAAPGRRRRRDPRTRRRPRRGRRRRPLRRGRARDRRPPRRGLPGEDGPPERRPRRPARPGRRPHHHPRPRRARPRRLAAGGLAAARATLGAGAVGGRPLPARRRARPALRRPRRRPRPRLRQPGDAGAGERLALRPRQGAGGHRPDHRTAQPPLAEGTARRRAGARAATTRPSAS